MTNDNSGAHLWAFITAKADPRGYAGWAAGGVICHSNKSWRTSINAGSNAGKPSGLAHIIAHEAGHNLGMSHDFIGNDSSNPRFTSASGNCLNYDGYMSYHKNPNKWSPCSVEDFTTYFNDPELDPWCLELSKICKI